MYINNLGHMTKMAAMPIYGKNPSKIIFSETNRLISRKLGVRHRWLKYSNVYINHDPVMTLTGFPRSGKSQGKIKKVQGQGKVREFCFWSGKFEILAKVREKSGNFRI